MSEKNINSVKRKSGFNFIYIFLALIVIGVATWQYSIISKDITVSITEVQVQETINKTPLKPFSKLGVNVNIHHLNVDFLETDKVLVDSHFLVNGYSIEAIGKGQIKTSIRYENGNFYLREPEFRYFKLIVKKQRSAFEELKTVVTDSFTNLKNKFKPEDKNKLKDLAKSFVDKYKPQIKLMVEEELTKILTEKPIYSLNNKDIKHSIAALVIQKIEFTDKEAIGTLKPTAIFKSPIFIISGIFVCFMFIVFFLFRRK